MAVNRSPNAYPDARRFLDTALDREHGVAVDFNSEADAKRFRQRCYQVRSNVRHFNAQTYEPGSAMHGASPWDSITLEVRAPDENRDSWTLIAWGDELELKMFDPVTGEEI